MEKHPDSDDYRGGMYHSANGQAMKRSRRIPRYVKSIYEVAVPSLGRLACVRTSCVCPELVSAHAVICLCLVHTMVLFVCGDSVMFVASVWKKKKGPSVVI